MLSASVVLVAILCAVQAIRVKRLLVSGLWLAILSALVSVLLYLLGAYEVAAIELSVGAGLISVLFVFAIALSGEEEISTRPVVPTALATMLCGLTMILVGLIALATSTPGIAGQAGSLTSLAEVFWQQRAFDAILLVVIIFVGALTVLGLLEDVRESTRARLLNEARPNSTDDVPLDIERESQLVPLKQEGSL